MVWLGSRLSHVQSREGGKGYGRVAFVAGEHESSIVFGDNAPEEDLFDEAPRRERAIGRILPGELEGRVIVTVEAGTSGEALTRVVSSASNSTSLALPLALRVCGSMRRITAGNRAG